MAEEIGERVAVLEQRVDTLEYEVGSLRTTRHEHAQGLQRVADDPRKIELLDTRVDEMERWMRVLTTNTVPEFSKTLEKLAKDTKDLREGAIKSGSDFGWVMRILTFVLLAVMAIAQGATIMIVKDALARPAPISAPAPAKKFP